MKTLRKPRDLRRLRSRSASTAGRGGTIVSSAFRSHTPHRSRQFDSDCCLPQTSPLRHQQARRRPIWKGGALVRLSRRSADLQPAVEPPALLEAKSRAFFTFLKFRRYGCRKTGFSVLGDSAQMPLIMEPVCEFDRFSASTRPGDGAGSASM